MNDLFDIFDHAPVQQLGLKRTIEPQLKPIKKFKPTSFIVSEELTHSVEKDFKDAPTLEKEASTTSGQVKISHNIKHQVALPQNYDYIPLSEHDAPEVPARVYPFVLDDFQATAISAIERLESVLVAAHTSAGKTVVAEYAIATSLKNKQRVIYTSPIKALSNQKYRELLSEFGDVGLMTGDVSINPTASCLVMTTEILRSMLYRGSEVIREVAWIVFDEIHYMRDKSRGVVWEETIILVPDNVRFVFLSATIPNAMQFAQWICHLHQQPCHVVYTDYRPTPLQHYLFPAGGDGINLCVDEKGNFREDNFQRVVGSLQDSAADKKRVKGGKKDNGNSDLFKIIKMIMVKNYHPVIVFSFAKRECESNALQVSKLDFNDDAEKEMITAVFNNAILSLSEEDRQLPQIEHLLPLLKRGIGIHHSGLLPILKEVIEILFQESLVKVLFATETFSIGLNMPAKTVVFTSVEKFDGKETRFLGSGEYIQMSGRAGRRGLDDRGIVILMINQKMEPSIAKGMLKGEADRLDSAFYLTYSMILNMIRVEGAYPEHILEKSFYQFQTCAKIPELEQDLEILEHRHEKFIIPQEELISSYYDLRQQLDQYERDYRDVITNHAFCLPFLQPGRLFKIKVDQPKPDKNDPNSTITTKPMDFGWGVLINYQKRVYKNTDTSAPVQGPSHVIDMLLYCAPGTEQSGIPVPCLLDVPDGEMLVVPCTLSSIEFMSTVKVNAPKDIKNIENRNQMLKVLKEIEKRFGKDGIPLLDPIQDLGIRDESFLTLIKKIDILKSRLKDNPIQDSPDLEILYDQFLLKQDLISRIRNVKKSINSTNSIIQLDELKCRKRVLRRMGYIDDNDVIQTKGRVACEISISGHELLLTEMIFQGVFNELSPEITCAVLSCFTHNEKSDLSVSRLKEQLSTPLKAIHEHAKRIVKVSQESKLALDEGEYIDSLRHEMIDVVYAWCQGSTFAQVCKMTAIYEGSIIRAIRNLEELLRQLSCAARAIGNDVLEQKFLEGIRMIKRDVVFAASLYL